MLQVQKMFETVIHVWIVNEQLRTCVIYGYNDYNIKTVLKLSYFFVFMKMEHCIKKKMI